MWYLLADRGLGLGSLMRLRQLGPKEIQKFQQIGDGRATDSRVTHGTIRGSKFGPCT